MSSPVSASKDRGREVASANGMIQSGLPELRRGECAVNIGLRSVSTLPKGCVLRLGISLALTALIPALCHVPVAAASTTERDHRPVGPLLNDISGWNQPGYYSTLQTADIDGDGQSDIVVRGKDGLHSWRLVKGAWIETGALPSLSDANGWDQPSFYQTIQFAHLQEGSRQSDLVARFKDGIHVWRYSAAENRWSELGEKVSRPFPDPTASDTSTEWEQPAHYTNILVGDLNHDGVDELIGRGKNGVEVYKWDASDSTWRSLSQSGPLTDDEGYNNLDNYYSIQLVSVKDGKTYLVARAPNGVKLYEWRGRGWQTVAENGPFADSVYGQASALAQSVRTYVDRAGDLWLYGLKPSGSSGRASIAVYRWCADKARWSNEGDIALNGEGWDRPSQYLTLRAGEFEGRAGVEILARSAMGMHVFARDGDSRQWRQADLITAMNDEHGYNIASSYYTIQTFEIARADIGGDCRTTLLLGRSPKGIEIYHTLGGHLTQTTPFPSWTNPDQLKAFQLMSSDLTDGGSTNIRATYDVSVNDYDYWVGRRTLLEIKDSTPPANFPSASDWNVAYQQLDTELKYVAAARAWFANNQTVSDYIYNHSANDLTQSSIDVQLQASTAGVNAGVVLNWIQLVAQIVGQILSVLGQPEASFVTGLIQDALQAATTATSGGNNNVQTTVDQMVNQLNAVNAQYTIQNAGQVTDYVQDWGLLQQIGVGSTGDDPQYHWGESTTVNELANAQEKGDQGQLLWMYKTLSKPAWHVYWCFPYDWEFGGCLASNSYPRQFIHTDYDPQFGPLFTAYVTINAAFFPYPNFDVLGNLTGKYGVKIDDMLADCDGWQLDDPADRHEVKCSSTTSSSSLTGDAFPQTLAALEQFRDLVKDGQRAGAAPLTASLDAAIDYIQDQAIRKPAPFGGAPNAADVQRANKESPLRYVDKIAPIQFLQHFIATVQSRKGKDLPDSQANSYIAGAYRLIGLINDDVNALKTLGNPNN